MKRKFFLFFLFLGFHCFGQFEIEKFIDTEYDSITYLSEKNLFLQKGNKKYIVSLTFGSKIKRLRGQTFGSFHNGLALVKTKKKYHYINPRGKKAFRKKYDRAYPFYSIYAQVFKNGEAMLIDKKGVVKLKGGFDSILSYQENYAVVIKNQELMTVDWQGNRISEFEMDDYRIRNSHGFSIYRKGWKYGIINSKGKQITKALYPHLRFVSPYFSFQRDSISGFMDATGKEIFTFDHWKPGLGNNYFISNGEKYAILNSKENSSTDYIFDKLEAKGLNAIIGRIGSKFYLLNANGEFISKAFDLITPTQKPFYPQWFKTKKGNGNFNFISQKGKVYFDMDSTGFHKVEMIGQDLVKVELWEKQKTGLIHKNGIYLAQPIYNRIENYQEGFFQANMLDMIDEHYVVKNGFLNTKGEFHLAGDHIDTSYEFWHFKNGKTHKNVMRIIHGLEIRSNFSKGYTILRTKRRKYNHQTFALMDSSFNMIIPLSKEYLKIEGPVEGLFRVKNKFGKWGFTNLKGEEIIKCQYTYAEAFNHGFAKVDGKHFINKKGDTLITGNYSDFPQHNAFQDGLSPVRKGDKWGYIKENGTFLDEFIYDEVEGFETGFAKVWINEQVGLIDTNGNQILTPEFLDLEFWNMDDGKNILFVVQNLDSSYSLIDIKKKNILGRNFDYIYCQEIYFSSLNQNGTLTNTYGMIFPLFEKDKKGIVKIVLRNKKASNP